MISHNAVNTNGFIYCSVYQGPHETTVYHNVNDGFFHASIYIVEGAIDTYPSDTDVLAPDAVNAPLEKGKLYDITHTKGKYVISKTGDIGASMVMFNPVPADKPLNIQIVEGPQTTQVDGTNSAVTVVCLTGPVKINGKTVESMQFAKVVQGSTATLEVNANGVCALVS